MKRIIFSLIAVFVSLSAIAQKDVTKFLGIPVDGTKSEMIRKLKSKGFRPSTVDNEILEGEFNGRKVKLFVATNGDKVYRIMVADKDLVDERSIQIRFNNLCSQFENNGKYTSFEEYKIPDDEKISYEMTVNNKRYEAVYYQSGTETNNPDNVSEIIKGIAADRFTADELDNPSEEVQLELTKLTIDYLLKSKLQRPVWFIISEFYGQYYILMYYDNCYNMANGEDL